MMRHRLAALTPCLLFAVAVAAAPAEKTSRCLDLQPRATDRRDANLGRGTPGNTMKELPGGEQAFRGVTFRVDEQFILLGSPLSGAKRPDKVEGIAVGEKFQRLRMLHGTFYGQAEKGDPPYVAEDTQIGRYLVRYEDGATEEVPIVYGQDVRDWWVLGRGRSVTRGRVAWEGDNDAAKARGYRLRIYLGTWENPRPDKRVTQIDFEKVPGTPTAPFCVALTIESD